ncbi:MAG: hypothetical protein SFV81_04880 [Pirellulaceae bacterium]|nr:hypothetical protein [Pirellulaceae bacterium]
MESQFVRESVRSPTIRDVSDLPRLVRYARTATREKLTIMHGFSCGRDRTDTNMKM